MPSELADIPDHLTEKSIGQRLKYERKRLGMTQEEFGRHGYRDKLSVGTYERGERYPSLDYLCDLAENTGIRLRYVLFGSYEAKSGERNVDTRLARKFFRLANLYAIDEQGKLLSIEHRTALYSEMCEMAINTSEEDFDPTPVLNLLSRYPGAADQLKSEETI